MNGPVSKRSESIFAAAALLVGAGIATFIALFFWAFDSVCLDGCTDGGARSWLSWAQLLAAGGGLLAAALTLIFAIDRRRRAFVRGLTIALALYVAWGLFLLGALLFNDPVTAGKLDAPLVAAPGASPDSGA